METMRHDTDQTDIVIEICSKGLFTGIGKVLLMKITCSLIEILTRNANWSLIVNNRQFPRFGGSYSGAVVAPHHPVLANQNTICRG